MDNLVDLIITCLTHPAAANQAFLVSDGEDVATTELLHLMSQAMGRPARLLPVPVRRLKLATALVGQPDVARRLFRSLQVGIEKNLAFAGRGQRLARINVVQARQSIDAGLSRGRPFRGRKAAQ